MTSADHDIVRIVRNGAHNEVYINGTRLHRMSNFTLEQLRASVQPEAIRLVGVRREAAHPRGDRTDRVRG